MPSRRRKLTILGADLSYAGTGLVLFREDSATYPSPSGKVVHYELVRTKPTEPHEERIRTIWGQLHPLALRADLTVIEGPAYGRPQWAYLLGMLGGAVRYNLYQEELSFLLAAPTSVKKHATGSGKATKEQMVEAAQPWIPDPKLNDNVADALALARWGLDNYDNLVEEE